MPFLNLSFYVVLKKNLILWFRIVRFLDESRSSVERSISLTFVCRLKFFPNAFKTTFSSSSSESTQKKNGQISASVAMIYVFFFSFRSLPKKLCEKIDSLELRSAKSGFLRELRHFIIHSCFCFYYSFYYSCFCFYYSCFCLYQKKYRMISILLKISRYNLFNSFLRA